MQYLLTERTDQILTITLNRPEKRNALNSELVNELKNTLFQAEEESGIKAVVLKGEGEAFCAGADLAYLQGLQHNSYDENLQDSTSLMELFKQIFEYPKPIIACVHGAALAGGCGIATVCDFAIAAEDASFGYTEVRIGFVPAIVMVFLTKKIGEGKARELLLSGDIISAKQALEYGLINKVVEKNTEYETSMALASRLAKQNSAQSMALVKKMLYDMPATYTEALDYAARTNAKARSSSDCKKGISAFLNKEKIVW
jgi:methylglutaconyl-CoA hydratase